jgi:hypothetical protein
MYNGTHKNKALSMYERGIFEVLSDILEAIRGIQDYI